jgi:hypothetical protein
MNLSYNDKTLMFYDIVRSVSIILTTYVLYLIFDYDKEKLQIPIFKFTLYISLAILLYHGFIKKICMMKIQEKIEQK